jgi:molybdate transport system substrate-binding protein
MTTSHTDREQQRPSRPRNTLHSLRATSLFAALLALFPLANAADVRVVSSGGAQQILRSLAAEFEKTTGKTVEVAISVVGTIEQKLQAGERADVVLLPTQLLDRLEKNGAFRAEYKAVVAQVGIGVAVREGAALPDVSTPAAVRALFVQTRSIAFPDPKQTPSGGHLLNVFAQLGIAEVMQPKITFRNAIEGGINLVRDGEIETGLYLATEILPAKGVRLAGTLPASLQGYIVYAAGVANGLGTASTATQFAKFLSAPAVRELWKQAGFEMRGAN